MSVEGIYATVIEAREHLTHGLDTATGVTTQQQDIGRQVHDLADRLTRMLPAVSRTTQGIGELIASTITVGREYEAAAQSLASLTVEGNSRLYDAAQAADSAAGVFQGKVPPANALFESEENLYSVGMTINGLVEQLLRIVRIVDSIETPLSEAQTHADTAVKLSDRYIADITGSNVT